MAGTKKARHSDIDRFLSLSDQEKSKVENAIELEGPKALLSRSRPLNARERARWRRFKAKAGRPIVGKGAKTISLSVERGLLKEADAFAKQHGISRAKMVALGLRKVMGKVA